MSNKIGRITTAGAITEFPVPTADSGPWGITVGPDGALWFTENRSDKIGRITTAGVITEIPIPTAGSSPTGITTGPDGTLWFTESNANKIGHTTTGGIAEFPASFSGSSPWDITSGPDGALWYTELSGLIGRITTIGVVTLFPNPNVASSQPTAITAGPDGALWFTETFANKIGRLALTTINSHDLNGDSESDIAWRDTGGNVATWLMNGGTVTSSAGFGAVPTTWSIVGQRDFNGDGTLQVGRQC